MTQIYYLTLPEARSQKWSHWAKIEVSADLPKSGLGLKAEHRSWPPLVSPHQSDLRGAFSGLPWEVILVIYHATPSLGESFLEGRDHVCLPFIPSTPR